MTTEAPTLGLSERREVAHELWRVFCMMSDRIAITYDQEGVSIRVPLGEEAKIGDDKAEVVYGIVTGYNEYTERMIPKYPFK